MKCKLVDVFTNQKLNGNGLTIFYDIDTLSSSEMLALTQEMRQFESIFLSFDGEVFTAKIFTMDEELDFAGHPLLGLAYHLHECFGTEKKHSWEIKLNTKTVELTSSLANGEFKAMMNQGRPSFIKTLSCEEALVLYASLNMEAGSQLKYPSEVISTGLPYLILPVIGCLDVVKFNVSDLEPLLESHGAKFIYVLDIDTFEGRTWDNAGKIEDVATGSAAGPAAAYLHKYTLSKGNQILINQGRFVGRPSQISVDLVCEDQEVLEVKVSGNVVKVADISFVQ